MQVNPLLEVGQEAPDFVLKAPGGQPVTLSEYRGKKHVVLVFFPAAFSGTCAAQMPRIEAVRPEIEMLGGVVLGVSVDNHFANEAFANSLGLRFPLLSDFHRVMSAAYGVLNPERGHTGRAIFLIDRDGRLVYRDVSESPGDVAGIPPADRLVDAMRALR